MEFDPFAQGETLGLSGCGGGDGEGHEGREDVSSSFHIQVAVGTKCVPRGKVKKKWSIFEGFNERVSMKIVFATGNPGKLREAQEILGEGFELVTPAEAGITEDIPETGNTLRANSLQKAQYIYDRTGLDCFADDTGLEVDILGGDPGVHTW